MDIPENVVNKALYKKVKEESDKIYKRPGLYRSAWIVKEYVARGGKYTTPKPESDNEGIRRWLKKERWVSVLKFLQEGKEIECGSLQGEKIACRPMVRASKDTPITLPELLKIHSKQKLISLAKQKEQSQDKRIDWKNGTIS